MMPQTEFIGAKGIRCPRCKGKHLNKAKPETLETVNAPGVPFIIVEVACTTCGQRYDEVYALNHYECYEAPDP